MEIRQLSPQSIGQVRSLLLRFIRKYGDHRITGTARQWIRAATPESLQQAGNQIAVAVKDRSLVGLSAFSDYGLDQSFIVIHPSYRNQDLGKQLIQFHIDSLGKVYGKVANDNIPSMKMCFGNGLIAFKLTTGPTGKPTLWFGGGKWTKDDVKE
jgi:GNAT superfamily N-acetyltransferase